MVQGGDIEKGDGTGVVSIYGKEYEDENLSWRDIDAAGLVCSANRGRDTNGSQYGNISRRGLKVARADGLAGSSSPWYHYHT